MSDFKLKKMFDAEFEHLKFNNNLFKQLNAWKVGWALKNNDHIEFLGGNTIGEQSVIMSTADEKMLFEDILKVNAKELQEKIFRVPGVDKTRKVATHVHYLTCLYIIHRFITDKTDVKDVNEVIRVLYHMLAYKVISSIISRWFKYKVSSTVAKTVSEAMSGKYILKKEASWDAAFNYRANDVLPGGIHYIHCKEFETEDIQKAVADLQVRIKDMVKNIFSLLKKIADSGDIIGDTSQIGYDEEGEETFKDSTINSGKYLNNIKAMINNPLDLIMGDLIDLTLSKFNPINRKDMYMVLKNMEALDRNRVYLMLDYTFQSCMEYLRRNNIQSDFTKYTFDILILVKGYIGSHTVKLKELETAKKILNTEITKNISKFKRKYLEYLVVCILTYLMVRSFYINKK